MRNFIVIWIVLISFYIEGCQEARLPKPKSQLSLAYEQPQHAPILSDCPFIFEKNTKGKVTFKENCSATIEYPQLNGSIFLTYRKVDGNINTLLNEAQKLTYEHVRKADDILEEKWVNEQRHTYGMFYDLKGNAASQSQFYITDSTNHFLTGSIYFNAKPNYDSIYPAAVYLKNDIRHLMETVRWE